MAYRMSYAKHRKRHMVMVCKQAYGKGNQILLPIIKCLNFKTPKNKAAELVVKINPQQV